MEVRTDSKPKLRLDHIAVWIDDIDKASKFLTDIVGWKRHPMKFGVSPEDETTGGMEGVFFDANGIWLELILPTSPGPGMDILNEKGSGAIIEINFEPADYDGILAEMKAKGVAMENMDGTPLGSDGGTIKEGVSDGDSIDEQGQRIAYWPKELSRGSTVEIYEMNEDDDKALLTIRDRMWKGEKPDPKSPRSDHIAIFVKDLEKTARFYTDVMGLSRHPMLTEIDGDANEGMGLKMAFIDTNGVWLELVQPTGPGPFMDLLEEKGDGYIAELLVEVDDIDAYYDAMLAKGVQMVDAEGKPFSGGRKSFVLEPFGTRGAYFPKDVSAGMTIQIYQRGPRETDIMHRRDDAWKEVSIR
jgi:catechol 2,3-dioxygenase-like lactoylglutathione lyase family enzyme